MREREPGELPPDYWQIGKLTRHVNDLFNRHYEPLPPRTGRFFLANRSLAVALYVTDPERSGRPRSDIPESHKHVHVGRVYADRIVTLEHYYLIVPGGVDTSWPEYDPILCHETISSVTHQPFWPEQKRPSEHMWERWDRVKAGSIGTLTNLLSAELQPIPRSRLE